MFKMSLDQDRGLPLRKIASSGFPFILYKIIPILELLCCVRIFNVLKSRCSYSTTERS